MDLRNNDWYGQLAISGVGSPQNRHGTIMSLFSEFLKDLQAANPKALASGAKEITIRISSKPLSAEKQITDIERILEVEAGLDPMQSIGGPEPNESFEEFHDRMLAEGLSPATAMFMACDWFERPQDSELEGWLNDPKAIRFRQLNSINTLYESAPPEEYPLLKQHVQQLYPNMVARLTLRVA